MEIGAQLYTVRNECKTLGDFAETLSKIADIGYKNVQVSGTCDYDAEWLADQLKKNGLKCVLTHIPPDRLINDTEKVAHDHDIFDCRYVGLGYFGFTGEDGGRFSDFTAKFGEVGARLAKYGKYFMYHNHSSEFSRENGKRIFEMLTERFPASEMGITLDTYWAQHAGADPAACIEALAGRAPCIHLKDHTHDGKMAVVGEGNINFDRVFSSAEKAGVEYMLVEQDDCYGEDPFECLKRSYEYLRSCGF